MGIGGRSFRGWFAPDPASLGKHSAIDFFFFSFALCLSLRVCFLTWCVPVCLCRVSAPLSAYGCRVAQICSDRFGLAAVKLGQFQPPWSRSPSPALSSTEDSQTPGCSVNRESESGDCRADRAPALPLPGSPHLSPPPTSSYIFRN